MNANIDPKVASIVKGLAYAENGGKPTTVKAGKTGELKSIFQYTPDTWKIYSKQVSGQDNLPLTPENEAHVTYAKVDNWYQQLQQEGVQEKEIPLKIASMWNAGEQRPDAYKQNVKGVNKKYGVAYDTPAYAKKVADYTKQFEKEASQTPPTNQLAMSQPNTSPGIINSSFSPDTVNTQEGIITPQMKQARQV